MATERLIENLEQKQGYEVFTSMLWVNVFANFFPPNNDDSWLFGPEFAYYSEKKGKGRCDLVLAQSLSTWPKPFQAVGLPFLAAEFKSPGSNDAEMKKAFDQLEKAVDILAEVWSRGQPLFGVTARGNLCTIYELENEKLVKLHHDKDELSMAVAEDRKIIFELLENIRKVSPALTAKFPLAVSHL